MATSDRSWTLDRTDLKRATLDLTVAGVPVVVFVYAYYVTELAWTPTLIAILAGLLLGIIVSYNSFRAAAHEDVPVSQLVLVAIALLVPFGLVIYYGVIVYGSFPMIVLAFSVALVPVAVWDFVDHFTGNRPTK